VKKSNEFGGSSAIQITMVRVIKYSRWLN